MIKKISLACAFAFGLVVIWLLSVLISVSATFQALEPQLVERCTSLHVHAGTEDIVIDRKTGFVFISATDRRRDVRDNKNDGIYAFTCLLV